MNAKTISKTLVATITLATLGLATPVLADNNNRRGAQYDYARVISADPIVRYVTVSTPVRECWEDVEYYTVNNRAPGSGASTLFGAIVGGVIGHQFGSGRGNDAATVAGTLIGAAVGNDAARRSNAYQSQSTQYSRPVRRCDTVVRERQEERIDGYNVVYRYNGQKYATRMPYDPGRELRVRVDIRPAG
jgi:uncharacterized protein YcfJ